MLVLYDFATKARDYAKATLYSDEELGRLLDHVRRSDQPWCLDFDPMWREVLIFSAAGEAPAAERLVDLLEIIGSERGLTHQAPLTLERPGRAAQGVARRVFRRDGASHNAEVQADVRPLPAGSGLKVTTAEGLLASVLEHGATRALRLGPTGRYPVTDAHLKISTSTSTPVQPRLADLHAAATQATSRALQASETSLLLATSPAQAAPEGHPTFPELENSVAETYLNLVSLLDYPVDELSEDDRSHLGAFIAYQLSLLYGHKLDEKMRRQPAPPAAPVQGGLGELTAALLQRCAAPEAPGGQMVGDLLSMWVAGWYGVESAEAVAEAADPDAAEIDLPQTADKAEAAPVAAESAPAAEPAAQPPATSPPAAAPAAYTFDDDDEDDAGC